MTNILGFVRPGWSRGLGSSESVARSLVQKIAQGMHAKMFSCFNRTTNPPPLS